MIALLLCTCLFTGRKWLLKRFSKLAEKFIKGLKLTPDQFKLETSFIFLAMFVVSLWNELPRKNIGSSFLEILSFIAFLEAGFC